MASFKISIEGNSDEGVHHWNITFSNNPKNDNPSEFAFCDKVSKAIAEAIRNIEDKYYII